MQGKWREHTAPCGFPILWHEYVSWEFLILWRMIWCTYHRNFLFYSGWFCHVDFLLYGSWSEYINMCHKNFLFYGGWRVRLCHMDFLLYSSEVNVCVMRILYSMASEYAWSREFLILYNSWLNFRKNETYSN